MVVNGGHSCMTKQEDELFLFLLTIIPGSFIEVIDFILFFSDFFCSDPRPPHRGVCNTGGDATVRLRNLDILVRNVKAFYEVCRTVVINFVESFIFFFAQFR